MVDALTRFESREVLHRSLGELTFPKFLVLSDDVGEDQFAKADGGLAGYFSERSPGQTATTFSANNRLFFAVLSSSLLNGRNWKARVLTDVEGGFSFLNKQTRSDPRRPCL